MKKFILAVLLSVFSSFALAATVTIPFNFVPGSGQVVRSSGPLKAGDTVDCTYTTPAVLSDGVKNGNVFVTQPLDSAVMIGTLDGVKRVGLLSMSWSFQYVTPKPATSYVVHIVVDADTRGVSCKLNSGSAHKVTR